MHDPAVKQAARKMRSNGKSVRAIAVRLGISRSTASIWVRDIKTTAEQQLKLAKAIQNGRDRGGARRRANALKRREEWIAQADAEWAELSCDAFFTFGLGLYWGEGGKTGRCLDLSNSDPHVHVVWRRWCQRFFPSSPIRLHLLIHDVSLVDDAFRYWKKRLRHDGPIGVSIAVSKASRRTRPISFLPHGTLRQRLGLGSAEAHTKVMRWLEIVAVKWVGSVAGCAPG